MKHLLIWLFWGYLIMNEIMMELFLFFYDNVYIPFYNSLNLFPLFLASVYIGESAISISSIVSAILSVIVFSIPVAFIIRLFKFAGGLLKPRM